MREAVASGLNKVDLLPSGSGYAEVTAGARGEGRNVVGYARGELGWKPSGNVSLFGFGEASVGGSLGGSLTPAWMAGVGARVTW